MNDAGLDKTEAKQRAEAKNPKPVETDKKPSKLESKPTKKKVTHGKRSSLC